MTIKKLSNIRLRLVSGMILGGIYLLLLLFFPHLLLLFVGMIALFMLSEWYNITHSSNLHLYIGLIIIPVAITSVLLIIDIPHNFWLLLTYSAIITSVDVFAMIGGKFFEGPKLAPVISPNKTISGLVCGVTASACATILISMLPGFQLPVNVTYSKTSLAIAAVIFGLLAQAGDLLKSKFKRRFGVKDSGAIIPGHGGVLDRFDGILITAPTLLILVNFLS